MVSVVRFTSTQFGSVTLGNDDYKDILVVGGKIIPRDLGSLHKRCGTAHRVAPEELDRLLSGDPEVLVVGTGQYGALRISDAVRARLKDRGVSLIAAPTPRAIQEYNRLVEGGKCVNALIHVTC